MRLIVILLILFFSTSSYCDELLVIFNKSTNVKEIVSKKNYKISDYIKRLNVHFLKKSRAHCSDFKGHVLACSKNVEMKLASLPCSTENLNQRSTLSFQSLSNSIRNNLSCDIFNEGQFENSRSIKEEELSLGDNLPYLWAQQYIGSDLTLKEMESDNSFEPVKEAILDRGFHRDMDGLNEEVYVDLDNDREAAIDQYHGTLVSSLIFDDVVGTTNKSTLVGAYRVSNLGDFVRSSLDSVDRGVKVVNISMNPADDGDEENKIFNNSLEYMVDEDMIPIISVGNDFSSDYSRATLTMDKSPGIVVGSLHPSGARSSFSQVSDNISIYAPADFLLPGKKGEEVMQFGGTSGATPLVKGSVDNAIYYLPELDTDAVKTILTNTGVKVFHGGSAPMVNSYKMFRVAKKLRELADSKKIDTEKRLGFYKFELEKQSTYDFTNEAKTLLDEGRNLLNSNKCSEVKKGFELVRKSFFLNQTDETKLLLSEINSSYNYSESESFYNNLENRNEEFESKMNYLFE